jgi:hypothetical protein
MEASVKMGKKSVKIISVLMAVVMCFGIATITGAAYTDSYPNTHRNTGQNIADLIAVARTQIGYTELNTSTGYPLSSSQDGGYTKYGASFGDSTGAWCAYFVSWCAIQAGISTSVVPRIGNCNTAVNWYRNHSEYYDRSTGYNPKTGDIIFYNWSGGSSAQHVGIITGVSGNNIYTVEGNTDSSLGYRCNSKVRNKTASYIVGYGVPAYNDAATYVGSYSFAASVAGTAVSNSDSIAYTTTKLAVITTTASEITDTNAILNGSVSNGGRLYITTAGFFFGTDKNAMKKLSTSYNTSKSSLTLAVDLSKAYGTLTPNTTYYYRTFATIDGRDYLGPTYAVVTVDDQPQKLVLSETDVNVGIGQTAEIMSAQLPVGSKDDGVTWSSPDENIATVSNDGVVTGVGYGSVALTATTNYGAVSAKCNINVLISAPQNIELINSSKDSITIQWDAVDGAAGYVIYRADAADAEFVKYKTLESDETSYVDKNLNPGSKYYYRIMTLAELEKYNSDQSDTMYTTARLSTPEISSISRCQAASIKINWVSVDDAFSYTVYRATSQDGLYTIIGNVTSTQFIDNNTQENRAYYYKIVASDIKNIATSDYSDYQGITSKLAASNMEIVPIPEIMIDAPKLAEDEQKKVNSEPSLQTKNIGFKTFDVGMSAIIK